MNENLLLEFDYLFAAVTNIDRIIIRPRPQLPRPRCPARNQARRCPPRSARGARDHPLLRASTRNELVLRILRKPAAHPRNLGEHQVPRAPRWTRASRSKDHGADRFSAYDPARDLRPNSPLLPRTPGSRSTSCFLLDQPPSVIEPRQLGADSKSRNIQPKGAFRAFLCLLPSTKKKKLFHRIASWVRVRWCLRCGMTATSCTEPR